MKKHFVAVAVDAHIRDFKDAEVEFCLKTDCVPDGATASGSVRFITAAGKQLERGELVWTEKTNWFHLSVERALKAWTALPASERQPGAVLVPERPPVDPKREVTIKPPHGVLIVHVFNRQLARDAKGELRYTVADDYVPALKKIAPPSFWAARFAESARDWLWITRQESQAMMPAHPQQGDELEVPQTLCERLYRFHLEPSRGYASGENFTNSTANVGKLRLTVEAVSDREVRLRLDGIAILEKERGNGPQQGGFISFHPRLLGYLVYNPATRVVTRFDMVALGMVRGYPVGANLMGARDGSNLLGIAFELIADPTPTDYSRPAGLLDHGGNYNLQRYLGSAK